MTILSSRSGLTDSAGRWSEIENDVILVKNDVIFGRKRGNFGQKWGYFGRIW